MTMPAPYRNVLGMMRGLLLRTLAFTAIVVVLPSSSTGQALGVLRVRIVLADADGTPTPAPRYALLVSDNPATAEPRRIITALDGTVEVKLRPGTSADYSSDPITIQGLLKVEDRWDGDWQLGLFWLEGAEVVK